MNWSVWLPIIAQFGIERGFEIWQIVAKNETPTLEQWQELREVNKKPLADYVKEAAAKLGIVPPPEPLSSLPPAASTSPTPP